MVIRSYDAKQGLKVLYFNLIYTYVHALYSGTIIEGPSSVTYLPDITPLPIKLTCNGNGVGLWNVNGTEYTLSDLRGTLPGHGLNGINILVRIPVNNTEYICVSQTNDGKTRSDPAYIVIAGEYICMYT